MCENCLETNEGNDKHLKYLLLIILASLLLVLVFFFIFGVFRLFLIVISVYVAVSIFDCILLCSVLLCFVYMRRKVCTVHASPMCEFEIYKLIVDAHDSVCAYQIS